MPKTYIPPNTEISQEGLEKLIEWEGGFHLKMYKDQGKRPTIGCGHLLTESELSSGLIRLEKKMVPWRSGITAEQAEGLLDLDLDNAENAVCQMVKINLGIRQFDALVMLVFNIGVSAFADSTLLDVLNAKDYAGVPAQFKRWNKVRIDGVKQVSDGLINRRAKELWWWNGGSGPMPEPVKASKKNPRA